MTIRIIETIDGRFVTETNGVKSNSLETIQEALEILSDKLIGGREYKISLVKFN